MSPQDPRTQLLAMQGGGQAPAGPEAPQPAPQEASSLCANCAYFRPVEDDGSVGVCQRLSEAQAGDPAWLESEGQETPPVFICTPEFACILWEPAEEGEAGVGAELSPSPAAPEDAMLQQLLAA